MRVLAVSDLHYRSARSQRRALRELFSSIDGCDLVIVPADLSQKGRAAEVYWVVKKLVEACGCPVAAVAGNHDLWDVRRQATFREKLAGFSDAVRSAGGWDLHRGPLRVRDLVVAGTPGWYDDTLQVEPPPPGLRNNDRLYVVADLDDRGVGRVVPQVSRRRRGRRHRDSLPAFGEADRLGGQEASRGFPVARLREAYGDPKEIGGLAPRLRTPARGSAHGQGGGNPAGELGPRARGADLQGRLVGRQGPRSGSPPEERALIEIAPRGKEGRGKGVEWTGRLGLRILPGAPRTSASTPPPPSASPPARPPSARRRLGSSCRTAS